MKIVLHVGQSKTGTTSLQESLHASAMDLRKRGVLYPSFGGNLVNHQLLLALCGCEGRLPPWRLEDLGGPEGAVVAARSAWEATCEDAERNRPELLVLSCEHIAQLTNVSQKALLARHLSRLSQDITLVMYVRHPVDRYRSSLQQYIKHRDGHFPPAGAKLKEAVLDCETAFGCAPELLAFDRKTMHGQDIVCDFATRFLAPRVDAARLKSLNANVGLSAEALVLLIRLRAEAGGTYEAGRHVARLVPLLQALDQSDPPTQPFTLLPEVAEAALRTATGHRWLAETGRLQLPGLDLDKIDGAPTPEWMKTAPPETLFYHDPVRLKRLRGFVDHRRPKARSVTRPDGPPTERATWLRDRLLRYLRQKLGS